MANVEISPNMALPVPVVGVDPGEDWATNLNACMGAIDSHNHSSGQGVPISPAGININADLSMNDNNLTLANSVGFTSLVAAVTSLLQTLQVVGVDLYYIDGAGNSVRITQGGNVTGSTGTITGLPSGTASASFAGGTFTFQSATNTPATMNVGPLVIGRSAAGTKTVTITPNAGQGANYGLSTPTALPAAVNYMTLDNTGAIAYNSSGFTGTGKVVLADAPTMTNLVTDKITIGGGLPFATQTYTGTNAPSATFSVPYGAGTVVYGVIGWTQVNGTTQQIAISGLTANSGTFVNINYINLTNSGLTLNVINNDSVHSNTYSITVFVI